MSTKEKLNELVNQNIIVNFNSSNGINLQFAGILYKNEFIDDRIYFLGEGLTFIQFKIQSVKSITNNFIYLI